MECKEAQRLSGAYVDGELDLVASLDLESHLQDCGGCTQGIGVIRKLREAVKTADCRFAPPAGMSQRVLAAIETAARTSAQTAGEKETGRLLSYRLAVWLAAAAVLVFAVIGVKQLQSRSGSIDGSGFAVEAVSSHIRSLQAAHLYDVASTDRHTVKPWFAGKLDFTPPVVDLTAAGYPLKGGRLDYIAGSQSAALVYGRKQHIINLFLWPTSMPGTNRVAPAAHAPLRGFNIVLWNEAGMQCCAVSDLNGTELKQFANEFERESAP